MTVALRWLGGAIGAVLGLLLAYSVYTGMVGSNQMLHPPRWSFRKTPAAYGIPFQRTRLETADGLRLAAWYVPAARATHAGVVVLHGFARDKDAAFKHYGLWLHRRFNLFLYDQRDSGASPGTFSTVGTLESRDALRAIAALQQRGNTAIGMMGESMGGAAAIDAGAHSPAVKAVWSDCSFATLADTVSARAALKGYPLPPLVGFSAVGMASLRTGLDWFRSDPVHWVGQLGPRPLYLVQGLKDRECPPSEAQRLLDAARGPKTVWWTPEAGHAQSYKLYPGDYARRMLDFFGRNL